MVNKAVLIGNVGADPEIRITTNQTKIANFSLATSETYKNKQGERITNSEWHNIVAFDKVAEIVEKYVKKGTQLYVEGKIKTETWEDKDGNKRYTTKIHVGYGGVIQMMGKKESEPQSTSEQQNDYLPY